MSDARGYIRNFLVFYLTVQVFVVIGFLVMFAVNLIFLAPYSFSLWLGMGTGINLLSLHKANKQASNSKTNIE